MTRKDLHVLFDGSVNVGTEPRHGYGRDDVEAWSKRPLDWNIKAIVDEVALEARSEGIKIGAGDFARAAWKIAREERRARIDYIMRPIIFGRLDVSEQMTAQASWSRLAKAVFDLEEKICVAVLQHFVWQVKRKQLRQPVCHHLMPIVVSPEQGSGKTTFVHRFLDPLRELASDPAALSDLADRRSGDLLAFPVVFVDDVERLDSRLVATLKSLITARAVNRRRLGTSMADKRRQQATLIGTANEPVSVLIADPTGHRRFVELPFRNGAVVKGGDPEVWRVVDETDFTLLWRSVDGSDPSPILPHLSALVAAQAASAPVDRLRECLVALDPRSEDVQGISERGGVPAEKLRLLVCASLREEIGKNAFSARMAVLVHDLAVPFAPKKRVAAGYVYPFKPMA